MLLKDGSYVTGETAAVVTEENIQKAFGVEAIVSQVEVSGNVVKNVVPVCIASKEESYE